MRRFRFLLWLLSGLACALSAGAALGAPPLQLYVELTPPGGTLRPQPGTYSGPVVIDKPITIDGGSEVTVDGGGRGTVLSVRAPGSVIRGLHLTNSGGSHDGVDAGVLVAADRVTVEANRIDEVLFGIHLQQANDSIIRNNRITSRPLPEAALRGDAVRMWYSHGNLIEGNRVEGARDLYFANVSDNRIIGNEIRDSRVAMEFVRSPNNHVEGNILSGNRTGIVVLYSDDLTITGNRISHARDIAGSALAFKDSSGVVIENNEILHCAVGLQTGAPVDPENSLLIRGNHFVYNDIAMYFYGEKGGHRIHGNRFDENLLPVAVSGSATAINHDWRGNRWDDYMGFDRDGDGIGDTPHELWLHADRLWLDRPMARFFRGSPVLELIDFMERLAPFSKPELVLRDSEPRLGSSVR